MRYSIIFNILGTFLKHIGALFIVPIIAAFFLNESKEIIPFLITGIFTIALGFLFTIKKVNQKEVDNIKKTESLTIVFFSWVLFALIYSIPYLFYNMSFTNACFESMSGITTTGATIMQDFSLYPKTLFFFRSLSQWLGGMGIVVLFIAVLPRIAVAGRQMFYAEAPVPTQDKATPRIRYTASWLWAIYLTYTILEIIALKFCGLDLYHATITSFSTIATGGLSAMPNSIIDYNNTKVTICVLLFMFLAGINYIIIYRCIKNKKPAALFKSEELKIYTLTTIILSLLLAFSLILNSHYSIKDAFINSSFEIITTMTTTGFAVDNYVKWDIVSKIILFLAFFTGGCAASTSGGIKIIRWVFIAKYLKRELNKIIHPQGVYPIKLEGSAIASDIISQMVAFLIFYFLIYAIGVLLILLIEKNAVIAFSTSITALGNVGPAYGIVGPLDSFAILHTSTRWILILLMLIGRLEIIPFLAILNKDLWKN